MLKQPAHSSQQVGHEVPGIVVLGPFLESPENFLDPKSICETANRLLWRADVLTFFQGNKRQHDQGYKQNWYMQKDMCNLPNQLEKENYKTKH